MKVLLLCVFTSGVLGILWNVRNLVKILMSIELMLLGVSLMLIEASLRVDDMLGQVLALLVLSVAAGESAVGLGILVSYYRLRGDVSMERLNLVQG